MQYVLHPTCVLDMTKCQTSPGRSWNLRAHGSKGMKVGRGRIKPALLPKCALDATGCQTSSPDL